MREIITEINNSEIITGYKITYHELRGYDSPDRWYEVSFKGRKIGGYGSIEECLEEMEIHYNKGRDTTHCGDLCE